MPVLRASAVCGPCSGSGRLQRQLVSSTVGRACHGLRRHHRAAAATDREVYPGPEEEREVSHEAFVHAFEASRPEPARVPGLQQFAAAVWERRRRIPTSTYNDPLDHIFVEFDVDGDGHLTAAEVATALQSRSVDVTPEQVQVFIDAIDENNNGTVERQEFANFIFHMASADLHHGVTVSQPAAPGQDASAI